MMQSIGELSGSEVLNLITNGEVLFCPVCNSALVTIPNTIQNGERPIGVACPVNQNITWYMAKKLRA